MPAKIVFRPIYPKDGEYFDHIEETLRSEFKTIMLTKVATTLSHAMANCMKGWDHVVPIVNKLYDQKTQIKLTVIPSGTNKKYWAFVSLGTKEHTYGAKKGGYLTVREGYIPKTTPGGVYGGPGTYNGDVRRQYFVTQFIKPRHFEEQIIDKYEATIIQFMGLAVERALRRVG